MPPMIHPTTREICPKKRSHSFEAADGDWEISLFVDNLTGAQAELYKYVIPPGSITVNRPRE